MSNVVVKNSSSIAMTPEEIQIAESMCNEIATMDNEVIFDITQTLYEGVYYRTLYLPAGHIAGSALITIPTTVIVQGHMNLYIGSEVKELKGYNIITASANRKQVGYAIEDTYMTMCFRTDAKTVEEAETEFTNEVDKLQTRKEKCQE